MLLPITIHAANVDHGVFSGPMRILLTGSITRRKHAPTGVRPATVGVEDTAHSTVPSTKAEHDGARFGSALATNAGAR